MSEHRPQDETVCDGCGYPCQTGATRRTADDVKLCPACWEELERAHDERMRECQ